MQISGPGSAMGVAETFDYLNLRIVAAYCCSVHLTAANNSGGQWGFSNTVLIPYELGWRLPCDFRVRTSLGVGIDDATTSPGHNNTAPGVWAPSGNGYYWFDPSVGISWLHAGWNLSVNFRYDFPLKNGATDYQSGQQLSLEYTAAYTWRKWTFGVGAAEQYQTTGDTQNGAPVSNSREALWTVGPMLATISVLAVWRCFTTLRLTPRTITGAHLPASVS